MQRVAITRLLREKASQETSLIMEATENNEEIRIGIPWRQTGVLALEARGLNDRCPLYSILLECVAQLGGSFGPVVITRDEVPGNRAAISLVTDGRTTWISADLVELIALALHLQLPIYVNEVVTRDTDEECAETGEAEIPSVFHETFQQDTLAERDEDPSST